jgi:hypothetical protein
MVLLSSANSIVATRVVQDILENHSKWRDKKLLRSRGFAGIAHDPCVVRIASRGGSPDALLVANSAATFREESEDIPFTVGQIQSAVSGIIKKRGASIIQIKISGHVLCANNSR